MLKPFLSDFSNYCENLNLAQNSIKEILRYIRRFDDDLHEQHLSELSHMTYQHVAKYLSRDDTSPTTVKTRIRALKKFFCFLQLNDYIKDNIAKDLNPAKI